MSFFDKWESEHKMSMTIVLEIAICITVPITAYNISPEQTKRIESENVQSTEKYKADKESETQLALADKAAQLSRQEFEQKAQLIKLEKGIQEPVPATEKESKWFWQR